MIDSTSVKFTSWIESRMNSERSSTTLSDAPAGISRSISGNMSRNCDTTSTVFEPGCR